MAWNFHKRLDILSSALSTANLKYAKIVVRASQMHGSGIFATDEIPSNKYITLYPMHAVWKDISIWVTDQDVEFIENIEAHRRTYGFNVNKSSYGHFTFIGNPSNTTNLNFVGHMLNDSVGNIYKHIDLKQLREDKKLFKNILARYFIKANENNCAAEIHQKLPIIMIKTVRPIAKDEELTISYSPTYWFCHEYGLCTPDFEKLFGSLSHQEIVDLSKLSDEYKNLC